MIQYVQTAIYLKLPTLVGILYIWHKSTSLLFYFQTFINNYKTYSAKRMKLWYHIKLTKKEVKKNLTYYKKFGIVLQKSKIVPDPSCFLFKHLKNTEKKEWRILSTTMAEKWEGKFASNLSVTITTLPIWVL